jgi:3-dehydroquinate dehydratase I
MREMICIPIMARDSAEAIKKMSEISPLADLMEIRLDVMESFDLKKIVQAAVKPVIVTYRSKKEGGRGLVRYETRLRHLLRAVEVGADFVDVEFSMPQIYRQEIFQAGGMSRLILSVHFSNRTPPTETLEDTFRKMTATGADIVKIITYAMVPEDNLRVLGLIPLAQDLGVKIIAFCMGPLGRISRISTLMMGGYLSFASFEEGEESASGQIPVRKMRRILELLT